MTPDSALGFCVRFLPSNRPALWTNRSLSRSSTSSLVSSAHRNHLNIFVSVKDVLDRLLAGETNYDDLRPDVWKQSHPEAIRVYRVEGRPIRRNSCAAHHSLNPCPFAHPRASKSSFACSIPSRLRWHSKINSFRACASSASCASCTHGGDRQLRLAAWSTAGTGGGGRWG